MVSRKAVRGLVADPDSTDGAERIPVRHVRDETEVAETAAACPGVSPAPRRVSRRADAAAKRVLDGVLSALLLVVLAPLLVAIALAVKLDSAGPVFYRCRRVGLGGGELRVLKFRKMRDGSAGPALTGHGDARLTRVGRFLAETKLDELPQLWNVLTGEMSLVGPRPEDPRFVALRSAEYTDILRVKPGITGLCQLAFSRESNLLDRRDCVGDYVSRLLPQKAALDRLYAQRRTFLLDLRILAWTAFVVLARGEVAVSRADGRLTLRRRRPGTDAVAAVAEALAAVEMVEGS